VYFRLDATLTCRIKPLVSWVLASAASVLSAIFWDTTRSFLCLLSLLPLRSLCHPSRVYGYTGPICVPLSLTVYTDVFSTVGPPKGEWHYNIPEKVKASLSLKPFGLCILPSDNPFYYVYSGETNNLKARAREHMSGSSRTACLALSNYPSFLRYEWRFYFTPCPPEVDLDRSKILRVFGEQMWRAKYGWPILCGK